MLLRWPLFPTFAVDLVLPAFRDRSRSRGRCGRPDRPGPRLPWASRTDLHAPASGRPVSARRVPPFSAELSHSSGLETFR